MNDQAQQFSSTLLAAIIQAHGAEIALPTHTLHIESAAGEARMAD
jgi:hypothetical protein